MIAVDTNVLARYLLNDDVEQAKAAVRLLSAREPVDVPLSVWLELVWVLQIYDCSKAEIAKGLRHIVGLPCVRSGTHDIFLRALSWFEEGMDFADALHLAMSAQDERFASFDKVMMKMAARIGASPRVAPP